ncbi:MAG: pyroglutamyl-peptidase I [Bacteroidaceae bacterium]|nr:pyroglutamyl-peptidase I [Bacteroidaceae bacterium]
MLLTGFEPFGKYSENSSWAVTEKVAACGVVGAELMAMRLPVSFAGVGTALRKAVDKCRPHVIIMLGQCAGADYIKLERIAINMMDATILDNDGYMPDEEQICADGDAALFTNVDIKKLRKAVEEQGIPAKVSNSAGLYVCNRTYYEALRLCCERPGMKALFVHLPFYDGQLSATDGQPTMPLDDMVKAVGIITTCICRRCR